MDNVYTWEIVDEAAKSILKGIMPKIKSEELLNEYFGLTGETEHDFKTKEKQKICRKHGIRLISIYPADLVSVKRLESKLKGLNKNARCQTRELD